MLVPCSVSYPVSIELGNVGASGRSHASNGESREKFRNHSVVFKDCNVVETGVFRKDCGVVGWFV